MAKTRARTRARAARPAAPAARRAEPTKTSAQRIKRTLDAVPDRIDIRDWVYRPHLSMLPDQLINCDSVPEVVDQGREGACTGFALAAVINYHLGRRNLRRQQVRRPRAAAVATVRHPAGEPAPDGAGHCGQ